MMIKEVLKNHMTLHILTASQGSACNIVQNECCLFIPDESSNITHFKMKNQISALSDPLSSLGYLLKSQSDSGNSWFKSIFMILITVTSYITYILFYKIVSCITQCVTRSPTKLMIVKHPEAIYHIYSSI